MVLHRKKLYFSNFYTFSSNCLNLWSMVYAIVLLFLWFLVHVDIWLTTYVPHVDKRGHLIDHIPTLSCPRNFWTTPKLKRWEIKSTNIWKMTGRWGNQFLHLLLRFPKEFLFFSFYQSFKLTLRWSWIRLPK